MAFERIKNIWSAFRNARDPTIPLYSQYGYDGFRPGRTRYYGRNNLKMVVGAIYNQIAVDCSLVDLNHVRIDENGRYIETINSKLNRALTVEANVDQTGRELIREAVTCMLNTGYVAIVPTHTTENPIETGSYDIYELRVAKVLQWYPKHVKVEVYNEETGKKEELVLEKSFVVLVENPFYDIMNEPNSIGQRLVRVLNQLDKSNEESCTNKLDLIIQLPYMIKSEARRKQAEQRRKDIEFQLTNSAYGVAYTDGTERIVQLNRSLENNLWNQSKDLQDQLYNQLGLSKTIFDGTADEKTLLNYNNRTIEPILTSLSEEMERKWISRTAQTQGQAIHFFDDPFRLVPVSQLAEIADKFTRNEIMTSNEIRSIVHMKPIDDPKADELRNANINQPEENSKSTKFLKEEYDEV